MSAQPKPVPIVLQRQCGFQQIGEQMFVIINIGNPLHGTTIVLPVDDAKNLSREIKEAAETAAVQVIKPVSAIATA